MKDRQSKVFHLYKLVQTITGTLPAESGLFDPSEWGDLCRDQNGIDANHAAFYRFGYFPNPHCTSC
jgi:hypothetical protein